MSVSINRLQGRSIRRGRKGEQARTYLDLFEQRYFERKCETFEYLEAMRHEGSNEGRGQVGIPIGVNATEVRVTARPHARRSSEYLAANGALIATPEASYLELSRDVAYNYSAGRGRELRPGVPATSECVSYSAPVWYIEAMPLETVSKTHSKLGSVFTPPEHEKPAKRRTARPVDVRAQRAAALRAVVGNADTDAILSQ